MIILSVYFGLPYNVRTLLICNNLCERIKATEKNHKTLTSSTILIVTPPPLTHIACQLFKIDVQVYIHVHVQCMCTFHFHLVDSFLSVFQTYRQHTR